MTTTADEIVSERAPEAKIAKNSLHSTPAHELRLRCPRIGDSRAAAVGIAIFLPSRS
jgi:hypothetical protein